VKRISFAYRFVNESEDDLIPGKIHTVRENYDFWKRFEGKDLALFYWVGKPYQRGSTQKVFCIKRLVYVQRLTKTYLKKDHAGYFSINGENVYVPRLAENDGLTYEEFMEWFRFYSDGYLGILHFTDYRYRG
jgi:hypothetical protein